MNLSRINEYITKEPFGTRARIDEGLKIFLLRPFQGEKTEKRMQLLRFFHENISEKTPLDHSYSALYYFKIGNQYIELDVSVSQTIEIDMYVFYNKDYIHEDLELLLQFDRYLFCVFKKFELQE